MHRSVLPGGHGRNLGRPDGVKARPRWRKITCLYRQSNGSSCFFPTPHCPR